MREFLNSFPLKNEIYRNIDKFVDIGTRFESFLEIWETVIKSGAFTDGELCDIALELEVFLGTDKILYMSKSKAMFPGRTPHVNLQVEMPLSKRIWDKLYEHASLTDEDRTSYLMTYGLTLEESLLSLKGHFLGSERRDHYYNKINMNYVLLSHSKLEHLLDRLITFPIHDSLNDILGELGLT